MSLCIMLTILYFMSSTNYICRLRCMRKVAVKQWKPSRLSPALIMDGLRRKARSVQKKACLIDKHWKCHCLLGRAWTSPTLIVTMASACGIMSLLHPGSRYQCMPEISMYMHYLKSPCIMVYSCGARAQLSRQQYLHYEQIHYKWLCTKKPRRITMVIMWYYKLADFTITQAFFANLH